jgi:hypothetical protein
MMKRLFCGWTVLSLFFGVVGQVWSDSIYWSEIGSDVIQRANLDGTGKMLLVRGQSSPWGPALDIPGGKMYWTDFSGGDIRRANLNGSGQKACFRVRKHGTRRS